MTSAAVPDPSRHAGLARLESFVPATGSQYARTRNFDFGPDRRGNTSVLSPYIRHRLVTETEVLSEVLRAQSLRDAGKFVDEVFWRTYFKGWLEQHPSVWSDYRHSVTQLFKKLEVRQSLLDRYNSATAGNTGIDCFDAWAKELVSTGYLHNHARMWFASIWVFTLKLPWQLGADFFLRHLLDGDPASNTCSWRWVSGLHTPGKTYLARVSNIVNYTDGRFNPQGQLATSAEPLTEAEPPRAEPLREVDPPDLSGSFALVITEEDCSPELDLLDTPPESVLGLVTTRRRSIVPVGVPAYSFATGAVQDAVARSSQAFGVDGAVIEADYHHDDLVEWAVSNHCRTLVTAYAPVGPVADFMDAAAGPLSKAGVRLLKARRRFDSTAWPHASRGYFRLKKAIPSILRDCGIVPADAQPEVRMNSIEKQATAVAMNRIPR
jgi:deoxyribodipyrimidine photo-lyase